MIRVPHIGAAGQQRFTVEPQHTISFPGSGEDSASPTPPVLSTPSLVWFLEQAAIAALAPCLEPGECSLGTEIEIRHLAPTPQGHQVVCDARVIHVEGPSISFQVEARDARELIARGTHRRQVVRAARFAQHVQAKARR